MKRKDADVTPHDGNDSARRFTAEFEHRFCVEWWTSLRLADCAELVYRHAVVTCSCGRKQSEAYAAWRAQNPALAAAHDSLHK